VQGQNAFGKRIWSICFIYCVVCRILIASAYNTQPQWKFASTNFILF